MLLSNPRERDWFLLFDWRLDRSPSKGNLSSRTPNRWEVEIIASCWPSFANGFVLKTWEIQTNCRHIIYYLFLYLFISQVSPISLTISVSLSISRTWTISLSTSVYLSRSVSVFYLYLAIYLKPRGEIKRLDNQSEHTRRLQLMNLANIRT